MDATGGCARLCACRRHLPPFCLAGLTLSKAHMSLRCTIEHKSLKNKSSLSLQLLQSCKAVAHGSQSQLQRTASCEVLSARPSAAQAVHKAQQVEAPQTTADGSSSSQSQPLSGSSLSAPDHVAVQHLSPQVVATHEQQQQPLSVPGKSFVDTLSQHTAEVLSTPASVSGQGESGSLQHGAAGIFKERGSGSASDVQLPQTAAADAWRNDMCSPSAEPLQKLATALLWHRDAVYRQQHSGLQMHTDAQLAHTEEVPGTPSQSSSEVDAKRTLQQDADSCSCAAASGHLGQLQMEGSSSGLSSSESACASSGELGADAADSGKQDAKQPNMLAGAPTSSWCDRPSSSDHSSEACSGDFVVACQQLIPGTASCLNVLLQALSLSTHLLLSFWFF